MTREAKGLAITDLSVEYRSGGRSVYGVQGFSAAVEPGGALALVGESGCGKSTVAAAAAGLVEPPGYVVSGSVRVDDQELVGAPPRTLREVLGRRVGMVFQEPMTSLNPAMRIETQIAEVILAHSHIGKRAALNRSVELLAEVGIRRPDVVARQHPHELSGGMSQRAMIAMAIALNPAVLIADEPTTALDVTIQARILRLLDRLRKAHGVALFLITHDLGVAAVVADEIIVMYAGQIVERGTPKQIIQTPRHPYTQSLMAAIPTGRATKHRLASLEGRPPQLSGPPKECAFRSRCAYEFDACGEAPSLVQLRETYEPPRQVRCHLVSPPAGSELSMVTK